WAAAPSGTRVDSISPRLRGRADLEWRVERGLPRPDVAQGHPHLARAAEAGFRAQAHVPPELRAQIPDTLVELRLSVEGAPCQSLFRAVEPSLPIPSESNVALVGGGFNVGFELLGYLDAFAGVTPGSAVLDIGCGTGRAAYALAYYLDRSARYEGF